MSDLFSLNSDAPVLVIGSAGMDLVGRLDADLHPGTSNPAVIRTSFGGVARNVAENLARLGHPVRFLSVVGEDEIGERLLQDLGKGGVDTSAVLRTSLYATGSYLAVINRKGELAFALDDMRALTTLQPQDIRQCSHWFSDASLVFLDANLPPSTLRTIFSQARRARLPVCADPTSVSLAGRLHPYLDRLALVTPNNAEAEVLCDMAGNVRNRQQALEAAKCLVTQGVDLAIVTLAEKGLCYATSETNGHIPALHTEVIDPTGAGDAFSAALIFALLNSIPLDDAVRLGISAASLTLRHRGTVAPDLTLEKLYDQLVI